MHIYTIYIKTHTITGLKYLGYTKSKDPHKYTGSGKYWLRHLNKHGAIYTTEILQQVNTKDAVKEYGIYYSNYYKILTAVNNYGNRIWANLKEEAGDGGYLGEEVCKKISESNKGKNKGKKYGPQSAELRKKKSDALKNKPKSEEHCKNLSKALKGRKGTNGHTGCKHTEETRKKISDNKKGRKTGSRSEETRKKMSEAQKGKPSNRKGKTWIIIDGKRVWKDKNV